MINCPTKLTRTKMKEKELEMNYYIKKIYHKKPIPDYILCFVVEFGNMPDNISKSDAQMFLRTLQYSLERHKYKRRNSIETLGVSHRIHMTDTDITVYTINDKPVVTFRIEKK